MEKCVPCTKTLTKAIERLVEFTNEMFCSSSNKAKRLVHVDIFRQDAIKKSCQDIEFMNCPVEIGGDGNENPYCLPPDHWSESVEEVHTVFMLEASSYQAHFVSGRATIRAGLDLEDHLDEMAFL